MNARITGVVMIVVMLAGLVVSACQPPGPTPEEQAALEKAYRDSVRKANMRYCMKHLSFATEYYKNKAWEDALANYKKLFDYMCVDEEMAQDVYVFMANCYRELGHPDSAIIYYDEGLSVIPDDRYLWESKIFALKTMDDDEAVIETKAAMLAQFPDDIYLAEELADDYLTWERYEEVIELADMILAKTPDNQNVSNMKRQAYEALGRDPIDFVRQIYEKNPDNIANAEDLANILLERGETTEAINVLNGIIAKSPGLVRAIRTLAEAYKETGQTRNVISTLMQLNEIDPDDMTIYFDITDAYIASSEYKQALKWAGEALQKNSNDGRAWANRAQVYEAIANSCTGATPDFSDKLVYQMAYEDYVTAQKKGYGKVNSKIEFMVEARIPQQGDWFFNKDDYVVKGKASPKKDCYSWLTRKVDEPKK